MFKSAVFKLTAWYVGALVLVCLLFSLPVYSIASARLRSGAERQTDIVRHLPDPFEPRQFVPQLEREREQQLTKDRHQLLLSLLVINLIIIGVGAYASYEFAKRTLKPIEDAHATQTTFAANASHELRTPLAVMQTEIEVALRDKKLSARQARDILASNLEEVARLRALSDQLLGLTQTTHSLKLSVTNISALLSRDIKDMQKRHRIKIASQIAPDITVRLDPVLFRQAIDILVENAVVYSPHDPQLRLELAALSRHARLKVIDHGPGIPEVDLPRLFDRFYRGSQASTHNPRGHGLGLSLAKDIIERHNGELSVKSRLGYGSEFMITLPTA